MAQGLNESHGKVGYLRIHTKRNSKIQVLNGPASFLFSPKPQPLHVKDKPVLAPKLPVNSGV